ncbi:MAG: FHA domain-containing protein, partial [Planctomycetota bacterium]|nr:FHA domain-containing protein [Planctomycetota bacterium]
MTTSLELHITGPDGTQVLEINDEPIRIGRSPDNDVALIEDNTLSRQHCIVEIRNGNLYVRDLNSRHGTWTRGKKLKIHRVSDGDIVFAGRSRLVFLPPGAKTPPMPKPRGGPGSGAAPARRPANGPSTQAAPGPRSSEHRKRRPEPTEARPQRPSARAPSQPTTLDDTENFQATTEKELPRSEPPPPPPPPKKIELDPPERSRPAPKNDYAPKTQARLPQPAPEPESDPLVYEKPPPPRPAERTIVEGDELPPLLGGEPLFPIGWQGQAAPADSENQTQMLLNKARGLDASDVHVSPGMPFTVRVNGVLRSMGEALSLQDVETLIDNVCTVDQRHYFDCTGDYDYCYDFEGGGRFRTNICRHRTGNAITFRLIKEKVLHLAELGIPEDAAKLTEF